MCICVLCAASAKERGREKDWKSALAWFASLHTNADLGLIIARVHSESFSQRFQQPTFYEPENPGRSLRPIRVPLSLCAVTKNGHI